MLSTVALTAEPWREVDQLVVQWNSLERQNSAVQSSWRQREPLLRLQLELLQQEKKTLEAYIQSRQRSNDAVDERRVALASDQVALEANQAALDQALGDAEQAMRSLQSLLPPPLADLWADKLQTLTGREDRALTSSERLQSLVGLINRAIEFDQRITIHNTTMQDPAGNDVAVTQLYLGMSQGWYRSADGALVGTGRAEVDAWQWNAVKEGASDLADELADMLEMLENPSLAKPVALPVTMGQR